MLGGSGPNPVSQTELFCDYAEQVAQDRDKTAFANLFEYYAPRLKSYLMRLNCEEAIAEEIIQDVFTTLWHKGHLFDRRKSSIGTWLFRIARNRRIDLVRRDKSDRLDPEDSTVFPKSFEPDDEAMDAVNRDQQIRNAIRELPEEQRILIRLSFFEGKSHGVIAEELELPLGTVKSRIRLAFTRLRKALSANEKVDID
ncbi:MAG: sigma-70 family RNA polymerase sigma factor [Pseudomonadota bacterium]